MELFFATKSSRKLIMSSDKLEVMRMGEVEVNNDSK